MYLPCLCCSFVGVYLSIHVPAPLQVWIFDAASDGVEMRTFTSHSLQVFLVRSRDASSQFVCKRQNVAPILLIPGPKAPRHYGVYWFLIFELFGEPLCRTCLVSLQVHCCCTSEDVIMKPCHFGCAVCSQDRVDEGARWRSRPWCSVHKDDKVQACHLCDSC